MKRRFVIVFMLSLTGCSAVSIANFPTKDPRQSTPVRWRAEPSCMQMHSVDMGGTRERLALDCLRNTAKRQRDFIAIGLSGGGTKAAVFSGETLFYMQALGLLQETSVVSTISGGSFAGAVYALSCDPADIIPNSSNVTYAGGKTRGLERPIWTHDDVLPLLGLGYTQLVREQLARLLVPGIQTSITAERFARFIDGQFLKTPDSAKERFLFSDFNPRRP